MTGNGLFISEGEFHRHQRKPMAPVFQPRQIAGYADTIVGYGERIQQEWHEGETIDLNQQMIILTMSIIGKVLFDADVFNETDELGAAVGIGFEHTVHKHTSLFTPPLSWPTPRNLRVRRVTQVVEGRIQEMIAEQRQSQTEHNNFLSVLLQARDEDGKIMSNQQLMDECLTLFGAGHETTAAALPWTWVVFPLSTSRHLRESTTRSRYSATRADTNIRRPRAFTLLPTGLQGDNVPLSTSRCNSTRGIKRY